MRAGMSLCYAPCISLAATEAHFKEAHRRFISKGVIYMLALPFFREHQFKISRLEL
jgi:hypothetical protein